MIDFSLRDYDTQPENVETIEWEDRILWSTGLKSPLANRVVKACFNEEDAEQKIKEILEFFEKRGVPFSWWIGPGSCPSNLVDLLSAAGLKPAEHYEGTVLSLDQPLEVRNLPDVDIVEAETEQDVRELVAVNASVWGYGENDIARMIQERLDYLNHSGRRGGFLLARIGGKAVATAGYRFSQTGDAIYLTGASTLPEYRNRGIFKILVKKRIDMARKRGAKVAICLARQGKSAPILKKLGFQSHCMIPVFHLNPSQTGIGGFESRWKRGHPDE
jgi:GNAT superfamily N-acetyltransferase